MCPAVVDERLVLAAWEYEAAVAALRIRSKAAKLDLAFSSRIMGPGPSPSSQWTLQPG